MTNQKVKIIARTVERPVDSDTKDNVSFKPDDMRDEAVIFSGKAAGVCYMADDYMSNGIQDEESALKRAKFNSKSGHYSVYDHAHFTFEIETSKAMAMVLNSTKLYSTSEKSGRYTSMSPKTEIEKKYYDKWFEIIASQYRDIPDEYTEREIEKLALENARYMLSVFTPTVMVYSLPFSRVILMCEWLDRLSKSINEMFQYRFIDKDNIISYNYFLKIGIEANDLADKIRETLNMSKTEPILKDHKDIGISFYDKIATYERAELIEDELRVTFGPAWMNTYNKYPNIEIHNDMYTLTNSYSFACLAQEQRHRTIDYRIINIEKNSFFVPSILKSNTDLLSEWINDMRDLVDAGIVPQGCIVTVVERGLIDNFYLKCKERMCMRAQEEIRNATKDTVNRIYYHCINHDISSTPLTKARMRSMINKNTKLACPRCQWKCYKCLEPCKHSHLF